MKSTLREHGLAEWSRVSSRTRLFQGAPTALVLDIRDGTWNLYGEPQGGRREELDFDARLEVDGDTVVVSHESESNTYRWSVEGEALELTWLDTTYGRYEGIPEEVFQQALYMTADCKRAG